MSSMNKNVEKIFASAIVYWSIGFRWTRVQKTSNRIVIVINRVDKTGESFNDRSIERTTKFKSISSRLLTYSLKTMIDEWLNDQREAIRVEPIRNDRDVLVNLLNDFYFCYEFSIDNEHTNYLDWCRVECHREIFYRIEPVVEWKMHELGSVTMQPKRDQVEFYRNVLRMINENVQHCSLTSFRTHELPVDVLELRLV